MKNIIKTGFAIAAIGLFAACGPAKTATITTDSSATTVKVDSTVKITTGADTLKKDTTKKDTTKM